MSATKRGFNALGKNLFKTLLPRKIRVFSLGKTIEKNEFVHTRRTWVPYVIFGISLLLTLASTRYIAESAKLHDEIRFDTAVQRTNSNITNRFATYITLLRATTGLFAGSSEVTQSEFKLFVEKLRLIQQYDGIQGIGYIARVNVVDKEKFEEEMKAKVFPEYHIYPSEKSTEYYPSVYFEPIKTQNISGLGFNMYSERFRSLAMDKARDTGTYAATSKVIFIQSKQPGFAIYLPMYQHGVVPATVEERRKELIGFVYSPFRTSNFLNDIVAKEIENDIDLEVYDGKNQNPGNLLYTSIDSKSASRRKYTASFSSVMNIDVVGRPWTLVFHNKPYVGKSSEWHLVPFIFVTGVLLSGILFILSRLQLRSQLRVEKYAEDLKKSQEKLQQSEERYRLVVENSQDLISLIGLDGRIVYASPSHSRVLGYSQKELVGTEMEVLIHPDDLSRVQESLSKGLQGFSELTQARVHHKNGEWKIIEGIATVIPEKNGMPSMILSSSRDITERAELEKRKDEFISMASHELKTPVTSLKVYTQLLERQLQSGATLSDSFLPKMNGQIDRLTNLIGDLLDLSKIQVGKLEYRITSFDLTLLVEETIESIQGTTDHTILIEGKIIKKVKGDRDRVGQVLINLLTNAIKYSPKADKIIVRLTQEKKSVQVAVQDFGIGIAKGQQERVFDRFYQVTTPTEKTYPGLGIGLFISSEIIKRHNGRMWVESPSFVETSKGKKSVKGSTFYFTLPLTPEL